MVAGPQAWPARAPSTFLVNVFNTFNFDFTLTSYNKKSRNKASEWTHPKRRVAVVVGPQAWPARAPSTKQSLIDQLGPTATLPPVLPSICSSTS